MSTDIVTRVNNVEDRLGEVEVELYGDDRRNRPGLIRELHELTEALNNQSRSVQRQTTVLFWVVALMIITVITVAMAVLV